MNRKALSRALAAALLAAIPIAGAAPQAAKAPQGSRDEAIKTAGYCNGEAEARVRRLLIVFSDKERSRGVSATYVSDKMLFLSAERAWMYKSFVAIGSSVENPDVAILNGSIAQGRVEGKQLADIEEQCRQSCADAKDTDALKICVDACAEKKEPGLSRSADGCDALYVKERAEK